MNTARVLREARRNAALSQRDLAGRAGVGLRTISAIESGAQQPTMALLQRLLGACGQHLTVQDGQASTPAACPHLREHLARSLTDRWRAAAGATGQLEALHRGLREQPGELVLEASAAVSVWVPGVPLALPLVVEAHGRPTARAGAAPDPTLVVVRWREDPLPSGLVRLRAAATLDLHVLAPAVLARQHCCRRWRAGLDAAAALLDEDAGRDDAGRRAPPHRQPDEDEEARRLSHSLRFTGLPRPDALDSRSLRLGAPVSLPQWLEERGLPPLLGQGRSW